MSTGFDYDRFAAATRVAENTIATQSANRARRISGSGSGWQGSASPGGGFTPQSQTMFSPINMAYDAFMSQYTGAGASVGVMSGQMASAYGVWGAEWQRMTPEQRFAADYGAGAVAGVGEYLAAIARGEIILTKDGPQWAPNVVSDADREALGQEAIDAANTNQSDLGRAGSDTGMLPWVTGMDPDELEQQPGYVSPEAPVPAEARPDFLKNPARTEALLAAEEKAVRQQLVDVYFSAETDVAEINGSWTDPEDRARWLMQNYPTLGIQAQAQGLTPSEVARLTNFTLAQDTALKILNEPVDWRAKQILFAVPSTQRALVADLVTENLGRMQRKEVQDEIALERKPWIVQRGEQVAGWLGSTVIDGLMASWEFGQQVGRASLQTVELTKNRQPGGWQRAWSETGQDSWDEESIAALSAQYGAESVGIIQEAWSTRRHGDSEAYFAILDKYADDPQAMALILEAMNDVNADPEIAKMVKEVAASTNDNLGNLLFRDAFGMAPSQSYSVGPLDFNPFEISRDVTNVTAAFVLDPLLAAGVAGKAVLGAKYGVWALANTDRTYRLFKGTQKGGSLGRLWDYFNGSANVRRYFNWYGGELEKIRGLKGLERSNAATTLLSQSKKYMSAEAYDSMLKFGVKDADSAYQWLQGADNLQALLRGQPAKRGKQLYVPHMSRSMLAAKKVSLVARGLDPTTVLRTRAARELAMIFGDDFADLPIEQQIKVFASKMTDSDEALRVGSLLSDYDGARSLIGRAIDKVAKSDYFDGYKWAWAGRYGWKKRKGENVFEFVQRRVDTASRLLARMPSAANGIVIDTAEDAAKVYEMMRLAGIPRYWASYFRSAWVEMTPGQRRLTMIGLTKTFGRASGIDLVDPINGMNNLIETVTGISSRQLYAPNMIDDFARIAAEAETNVSRRIKSTGTPVSPRPTPTVDDEISRVPGPVSREAGDSPVLPEYNSMAWSDFVWEKGGGDPKNAIAQIFEDARVNGRPVYALIDGRRVTDPDEILDYINLTGNSPLLLPEGQVPQVTSSPASSAVRGGGSESRAVPEAEITGVASGTDPLNGLTREEAVAVERRRLLAQAQRVNPSVENGISSAVWWGQTADRMALPNFQAIDNLRARQSFMGAMLMRNAAGKNVTDYWTFATLAGPRFQLRNGIEDLGLYVLTGGSLRGLLRGRQASTAMRESTERGDKRIVAAQAELQQAEEKVGRLKAAGTATEEQITKAEDALISAQTKFDEALDRFGGRGQKLGFVKTSLRTVADRIPVMQHFILPHLTKDEVAKAARLAQAGNRDELVRLMQIAFLRQKLPFIRKGEASKLAEKLQQGVSRANLSPRMQQVLDDLDDFVRTNHATTLMDEASETTRYLIDGTMPTFADAASVKVVNGVLMRRVGGGPEYMSVNAANLSPSVVRGIYSQLHFALHSDGPKGQFAMTQLRKYFDARRAGQTGQAEAIVAKVRDFIAESGGKWNYAERFALSSQDDLTRLARATLDDLLNMFTTQSGKFNVALYNRLRVPTQQGTMPKWSLYYKGEDGRRVENLVASDFASGQVDPPMFALIRENEGIWMPDRMPFTDWGWSTMGRSLARMTREPIFVSNYLDARNTLRPFEKRFIEMGLPPEYAKRKVADMAADRALMLTMSYVDNPMIRSQLAFAVRNIARFYRAQEDFLRRMVRMGENNPMGFWKALIAYEAVQETGFVHKDEYGEDYFIYPGSQAAIEVVTRGFAAISGLDASEFAHFPMTFGGKVQWITPSADPDSWVPSLSSPWASAFVRPVMRGLPITAGLEKELFGVIGQDKGIFDLVVPPNVRRAADAATMVWQSRIGGAEWASSTTAAGAARKAVLMLAAAGHAPKDGMTEGERRDYRRRVDTAAAGIMMLSLILGVTAPASPQLMTGEVSQFARELGITGFRPAFIKELQNMGPDDDYIDVYRRWVERDPDKAIYTVSESEDTGLGFWSTVSDVDEYLKTNRDVFDANPLGASFFSPTTGVENVRTNTLLRTLDIKRKREINDFMTEIVEADGRAALSLLDADYENRRRALSQTDDAEELRILERATARARSDLKLEYGISGKEDDGFWNKTDFLNQWKEITEAHAVLASRGNDLAVWATPLISSASQMQTNLGRLDPSSPEYDSSREMYRNSWITMMTDEWRSADGDERKQNLMKAATYAVWGPGGTTWPWSKPETSDQ